MFCFESTYELFKFGKCDVFSYLYKERNILGSFVRPILLGTAVCDWGRVWGGGLGLRGEGEVNPNLLPI
jgi:hypothetical protein